MGKWEAGEGGTGVCFKQRKKSFFFSKYLVVQDPEES